MFPDKIKTSFIKLLLPFFYKFLIFFKANSRTINFLTEKKSKENDFYKFDNKIEKLLQGNKITAVDIGSQGGFNSDAYFSKNYVRFFKPILFDPIKDDKPQNDVLYINKGLWSSKKVKNLYILGKRPGSSSMFMPNKDSLKIYGFKEKDLNLFEVTKTQQVECDTIENSLNELKINNIDYLKIDTQGAELEILKGLGRYKPLLIKCEVQIYSMYKGIPGWTELLNYLSKLNYMISDWKQIGSNSTRSPAEMDMIFLPNFNTDEGKKLILDNQDKFISIMLMSGQIELLKRISELLKLGHKDFYIKLNDRYFY
tara:strand:+ start:1252 stop:2187 length:936 start_codon:yes stop_codon:yes gene_type:complete